jgi:GTP:adenosylcobinamide-phosphate guanylyltransferase
MHGLILAGGEGSRLAADGITLPKPLVPVGGRPQVVRLAAALTESGTQSLTILVRRPIAGAVEEALAAGGRLTAQVLPCETPSSLHTLAQGLRSAPPGEVLCAMVDTVMPPADWRQATGEIQEQLSRGCDIVLVVTGYVDDEAPLWVSRTPAGRVTWVGSTPVSPPCVSGGVYGFSESGRWLATAALERGLSRMRGLLSWAASSGVAIGSVAVERIIDLDRRKDLEAAERWSREPVPGGGAA